MLHWLIVQHAPVGGGGGLHRSGSAQSVPSPKYTPPWPSQSACDITPQTPAMQHAPMSGGGGGHKLGSVQSVPSPMYVPPWFTHAASGKIEHTPAVQHAPAAALHR